MRKGKTVVVHDGNVEKALRKLKANAARNRWRKYLASQKLPAKRY